MERRRPRRSSRSKSNPSVGGGGAAATSKVTSHQSDGNGAAPTITSLLGGRLKRVSRITRASRGLQVTENPDDNAGGVGFAPVRDSEQSEGSDVGAGVMVLPASASPRGSAVHGPLVGVAFGSSIARNSDSPRISEEVKEVFRTSSMRASVAPPGGNLRFEANRDDSTAPGNINFAANSYYEENRESSLESNEDDNDNQTGNRMKSSPSLGACSHGWAQQQQQQAATGHAGRDTLGFAIHLGTATLGHNRCSLGVNCDEDCGYGTGCDAGCGVAHGIEPGSFAYPGALESGPPLVISQPGSGGAPPMHSALRGAQGTAGGPGGGFKPIPSMQRGSMGSDFGSDQLNFFITFLLEVLGVLVFFAICTITFWITLGYHVVQLLVDLKNADRNVQVAVAIVFGLLLIAFAISQVTNRNGSCCHSRDRARSRTKGGGICPFHRSTKSAKAKGKPKSYAPKAKSCAYKSKSKKAAAANDGGGCRRASSCGAKLDFHSHRKPRYTDCEGRAIFLSSRRYAIPTEMKQPPTIVLWLRDTLARMMA